MLYLLQCSFIERSVCAGHYQPYLLPMVICILCFVVYLVAASKQTRNKKGWNKWRTFSFTVGCALAAISFSPPVVNDAHHYFTGHAVQHLLLGMLAPIGLVLGAPVTLLLCTVQPHRAKKISSVLSSPYFHFISHPVTALLLNTGSLFLIYLTPLYSRMHQQPALHFFIHLHVLLSGYLFTWCIIGPDPAPRRPMMTMRMFVVFISAAAHAFLSKYLYAFIYPKNSGHSAEEIRAGAKLMYYGGDVAELFLIIALFTLWYNRKQKPFYQFQLPITATIKSRK